MWKSTSTTNVTAGELALLTSMQEFSFDHNLEAVEVDAAIGESTSRATYRYVSGLGWTRQTANHRDREVLCHPDLRPDREREPVTAS